MREQKDIWQKMGDSWPSELVARTEIRKFTGGGLGGKSIANKDCEGIGPKGRFNLGKKVVYPKAELIEWLRDRAN